MGAKEKENNWGRGGEGLKEKRERETGKGECGIERERRGAKVKEKINPTRMSKNRSTNGICHLSILTKK